MNPYLEGYRKAIADCVAIAECWRDENRAAQARALRRGRKRHALDRDETQLVIAEQLDGAATECNAMAFEMRALGEQAK